MADVNMRLYLVEYLGFTVMDKRFSRPMVPWVIAEIKRRGSTEKVYLGVHEDQVVVLGAAADPGEPEIPPSPQLQHPLAHVVRVCAAPGDAHAFFYVVRDPIEPLLYCYLFQTTDPAHVVELFAAMRHEQTRDEAPGEAGQATAGGSTGARPTPGRSMSTAAALTALPASISPSSSHFFEVLYIGKIKVSHKKVPDTFIDDALEKFRAHELEKGRGKSKGHTPQNYASDSISKEINSSYNENGSKNNENGGDNSESKSSSISASVSIPTTSSATATIPSIMTPVSGTNLNSTIGSYSSSEPAHNIIITLDNDNKTHSYPQDPKIHLNIQKSEDSTELNALSVNKIYPVTKENKETNSNEEQERQENNASNCIANNDNEKSTVPESNSQSRPHSPIQDSVLSRQFSIVMEPVRSRAASTGSAKEPKKTESTQGHSNHNRIMLFQVGRTDLHLISPDRKQILLHKHLKDVASCIQGIKHPDHFGFICRESNVECYIAYVFKCQSDSVADDVVAAITQAFMTTVDGSKREKIPVFSCEHCPMVWYHKLCSEIEGMNDKKTMTVIFRKLELLPEEEQTTILTKFQGAETNSEREQNEFLMMLLRAHCENKQARHVHDTAENRHEFLNQYLGGSTIFMKAKRSLTSSFDQLLKRKGSRDDFGPILKELSLPVNAALCKDSPSSGCSSPNSRVSPASEHPETIESGMRRRSSTVGSVCGETMKKELFSKQNSAGVSPSTSQQHLPSVPNTPPNGHQLVHQKSSPMMNIFFKVGNTPKTSPSEENHDVIRQSGSWRQAIFNRVVTPNKTQVNGYSIKSESRKKDRSELRSLWKKAINQQLLLIRMEKENAKLRARQEEATVKRIKLEYEEISPCMREVVEVWDLLISKESRITAKCDTQMLLQAIKQGVPRSKRGEVWQFLAEQHCLKMPPLDTSQFPNYNVPYETLLKQLTCHPHNILVDLGRTFPGHTYFASPLGPGQLALFNLLKAYSLLDPEVGYCQGLNFVAGVLLLHMSEDCAFFLLKHLMFRRGLRRQYLPDMAALQVQLYQLSRLLHDLHPDLYIHFDNHEVAPTLYAAPWILTVFASQFPLGFVTRVFDLIFLESPEVIFRVALALLGEHKDGLLACDNFEEIMDYLKIRIPNIDKTVLDKIMKMVFTMDITKQLHEYEVEYHVLQEEMASPRPEYEDLHRLEEANKLLTQQNQHLSEQLEIATNNIQRLETSRTLQQGSINRFESQVRSLEVSILTMGNFILNLAETRSDIEIPGEIRRLITHLSTTEQRRNSTFSKQSLLSSLNTKGVPLKVIDTGETYIKHCASHEKSVTNGNIISPNAKQSRGTPYPLKSTLSSPNLSAKLTSMSSFFGNANNSVKQQKSTAKHKVENNLVLGPSDTKQLEYKETSKIEETLSVSDKSHCTEIDPLTKSMSLSSSKPIPKLRATQSSFELTTNKSKIEECIKQNESGDHVHPLDSCLGVNFSYGGTTKLKTIRPLRAQLTRHVSSDSLQQKTDEPTPIIVPNSCLLTGSNTESENESQSLPSITQPKSKTTLLSR